MIIHLREYCKDGTSHGNLDNLLDWIPLVQEYGTVTLSTDIIVDGEVTMQKVESMIYVL